MTLHDVIGLMLFAGLMFVAIMLFGLLVVAMIPSDKDRYHLG